MIHRPKPIEGDAIPPPDVRRLLTQMGIPPDVKRRLAQMSCLDSLLPSKKKEGDFVDFKGSSSEWDIFRFEFFLSTKPTVIKKEDEEEELDDLRRKGLVALIHTAAEYNDEPALQRTLLEVRRSSQRSIINSTDWAGETALHKVAQFDCFECAKVLLEKDADIEALDTNGELPLHKAAREGSLRVLDLLLRAGERTDCCEDCRLQQNNIQKTKENWWRSSWLYYFLFVQCRGKAPAVRRKGLYVNRKDFKGETALHKAAVVDQNEKAVELLLMDEKRRCKKDEALNKRNLAGQTPCHLAAYLSGDSMLKYLVEKRGARYKAGMLASEDLAVRTSIFFAFFFVGCLGMLVIYLIWLKSDNKSVWNTKSNNCDPWYQLPKDKGSNKGGLMLQPNWVLFYGVFLFMVVKFFVETQALPALLFVWFWYKAHATKKGAAEATNTEAIHDVELAPAAADAAVTTANPMQCAQRPCKEAITSVAALESSLSESVDGVNASKHDQGLVALWERRFDPNLLILKKWRIQQFQSDLKKSYKYHHWDFFIQPEYIFLYIQIVYSIVSLGLMMDRMLREGGGSLSGLDLYVNIFARVVNSAVPSTVFSLFKMVIFDRRWVQIRHAQSIVGSSLGLAWVMLLAAPVLVIVPPLITHVVPGIFMFIWLVVALAIVYYFIRRLYRVLYPFEIHAIFRPSKEKPATPVTPVTTGQLLRLHYGGGWLFDSQEFFKSDENRVVTESDFSQYVYFHPRLPLYRYFFWFLLEIYTRFAFILLIQVLYDYVSIAIYMDGGSTYSFALRKTYDLRSQSHCYATKAGKTFDKALGVLLGSSS